MLETDKNFMIGVRSNLKMFLLKTTLPPSALLIRPVQAVWHTEGRAEW